MRRMPKVSIFMAVTTKIVTEKAQKLPKMARFWPKSRYNGRVMAREVFLYHWLWAKSFAPSLVALGHLGRPMPKNLS